MPTPDRGNCHTSSDSSWGDTVAGTELIRSDVNLSARLCTDGKILAEALEDFEAKWNAPPAVRQSCLSCLCFRDRLSLCISVVQANSFLLAQLAELISITS